MAFCSSTDLKNRCNYKDWQMFEFPIDDLFVKMFSSGSVRHPLMDAAWVDWNTAHNNARHDGFLNGTIVRVDKDVDLLFAGIQKELVKRYLYPNPYELQVIVRGLLNILYVWTTRPNGRNVVFHSDFGAQTRAHNPALFGTERPKFLEKIRSACSGGLFEWGKDSSDNEPNEVFFTDFEALWKYREHILEQIDPEQLHRKDEKRYDALRAKHLLGDPKLGWSETGLIAVLLAPIENLVNWVARRDNPEGAEGVFNFGKEQEVDRSPPYGTGLTPLGMLHRDLEDINAGGHPPRRFGVGHFLDLPDSVRYKKRFGDDHIGKTEIIEFGASHAYLSGGLRGAPVFFREALALGGYKYANWTMPTLERLLGYYSSGKPPASNYLRTACGVDRQNAQRLVPADDETILRPTWEGIKAEMARLEFELEQTQQAREAEQPRDYEEEPTVEMTETGGDPRRSKKRKRGAPSRIDPPAEDWAHYPSEFQVGADRPYPYVEEKGGKTMNYGPMFLLAGGAALALLAFS